MKLYSIAWLLVISSAVGARADFVGPRSATHAVSPNGNLLVRIARDTAADAQAPQWDITYHEFDDREGKYVQRSKFRLSHISELLYVSNAGDLIMISLGETNAIRLYSKEGKHQKSWNLSDFLSKAEIDAAAKTGSTLQWFQEGEFADRVFYFDGPSRRIRALRPPYTVMRSMNEKVHFVASIDAKTSDLQRQPDE